MFSVILSYVSSSPFLIQTLYGADAQQFGLLFGLNSAGLFVSVQASARLIRRFGAPNGCSRSPCRSSCSPRSA